MQRMENETFEQYRARRSAANKATKRFLKGTLFHDSYRQGTFINWEKRALKEQRAARKAQQS